MIVMGLDLSMESTGICVWDFPNEMPYLTKAVGTPKDCGLNKYERMTVVAETITDIVNDEQPELIVIERAFIGWNVATGMLLEALKAFCVSRILLIDRYDGEYKRIMEIPPQSIAKWAGIKGNLKREEKKEFFKQMIRARGIECDTEDEDDACVIAIAGLNKFEKEGYPPPVPVKAKKKKRKAKKKVDKKKSDK